MPDLPPLPKRLALHPGETWVVELPGMGSAGYAWTAEATVGNVLIERLPPQAREPSAPVILGASEPARFRISALSDGESRIRFSLARPWENEPPADLKELVVSVGP